MDKIIDDVRDHVYLKQSDLKHLYSKYTECETADQVDRVVMTREHFLKFVKHIVGERYSSREIDQVYRNLVSNKPMTLKKFVKTFT